MSEQRVEHPVAESETTAVGSLSHQETEYLLLAGNLWAHRENPLRALNYYGRALNLYLQAGRLGAAEALCKRMLEVVPETVRVRSTRMWLAVARGSSEEIRATISDYVRAGKDRGPIPMVAHQLRLLAEATAAAEVRELVAQALLDLGERPLAKRLFSDILAERSGRATPRVPLPQHEWNRRMLEATSGGPTRT